MVKKLTVNQWLIPMQVRILSSSREILHPINYMLELLLSYIPLVSIYLLTRTGIASRQELKSIALIFSLIQFAHVCLLLESSNELIGLNGLIGLDGISIWLIWLTCLIAPLVLLNTNTESILLYLLLTWLCILVFLSLDLILFYITYEVLLIPMFFLIGLYGTRNRKVIALYEFFLYTLFGSLFLLLSFIYLILEAGSTSWFDLLLLDIDPHKQFPIAFGIFLGFSVKVPLVPFHLWLPEAHVEAPANVSVYLAAILLKVGAYGMFRFLIPILPQGVLILQPFIFVLGLIGIIYTSLICLTLWDIKKFIAYSSVSHMNLAILGLFTLNLSGLQASYFFLISHGIISSALFFLIGFAYARFHTRIILYFRGLVLLYPLFILFFFIFTLGNIAFPLTSGFIAEILTFYSLIQVNPILTLLASTAIFLTPLYALWFFHQMSFGKFSKFLLPFNDLTLKELHILFPLFFFLILFGLNPSFIFHSLPNSLYPLLA